MVKTFPIDYVIEQYVGKERGLEDIADELGTYANKLRRMLKKAGTQLRSKAEAQRLALKQGRAKHPTKGKRRSQETKNKIGEGRAEAWDKMDENQKKEISNKVKKQWSEMTDQQKESLQKSAQKGIRKASKNGSKLENDLLANLIIAGYKVQGHKKFLISSEEMHLDIVLPDIKTIIEIDGPSHYLPIWGQEKLDKAIAADTKKNGLILNAGFVMIRIKAMSNEISNHKFAILFDNLKKVLYNIQYQFPDINSRLIYLEI